MMTDDTTELLHDYCRTRSEAAFRALVRQHSPIIYGTALRKLGGNRAAAQDVTQEVFTLLARKADRLGGVVLGGWLYRQTCRQAANHVRAESRRKRRESIVMENLAVSSTPEEPVNESLTEELDDALLSLPEKDRDALVLRFFEGKEFKSLGAALGLSEEAARKRVARALDRLTASLRRKGIAVGSVSLGTAMQGFGATPVPAGMVSQISERCFGVGGAFSIVPVVSLLTPIVMGVAMTSLGEVSISQLAAKSLPLASVTLKTRRAPESTPYDKTPSLEQLIIEIKRANSKPANSLTALQLNLLFGGIDPAIVPEFIRLANSRMSPAERASVYPRLLEKSLAAAPQATMDFVLSDDVGKQTDRYSGSGLLNNLFEKWMRKDRPASEAWLIANWEDSVMKEAAFQGSLRTFIMIKLVDERFSSSGVASSLELIHKIPAVEDQAAALRGIAGMNPWHATWRRGDAGKWLDFHQALKAFPDPRLRRELMQNFWTTLSTEVPDEVIKMQATMEPMDRFQVSLGWLAVKTRRSGETRTISGYIVSSSPITDAEQRETAAIEAGLAAGYPKARVIEEISRVLANSMDQVEFFKWFDAQNDPGQMDDTLAEKSRAVANFSGWTQGEEMIAVDWAMRISDPELRLKLCRGAFRMGLTRTPAAALAYVKNPILSPDLVEAFQAILNETP